jgi:hypothetical protein
VKEEGEFVEEREVVNLLKPHKVSDFPFVRCGAAHLKRSLGIDDASVPIDVFLSQRLPLASPRRISQSANASDHFAAASQPHLAYIAR